MEFKEGPGGQAVAEITAAKASATIVLQGAHLISWIPEGQQDVIWLSDQASFNPGKSIRGGIPVCWPWFGPHETEDSFPAHGYARTVLWNVISVERLADESICLRFKITRDEGTEKLWPYPCELEMSMTIGETLVIDLTTENTGTESFVIGQALHTYFSVADVRNIQIAGLESCEYLDKLDNFARKQQIGTVQIQQETDRIYLGSINDCLIEDPGLSRRIRINKQGSGSTVVWNPWKETADKMGDLGENGYLNMVCVESSNAADDVREIAPGEHHKISVCYSVEKI